MDPNTQDQPIQDTPVADPMAPVVTPEPVVMPEPVTTPEPETTTVVPGPAPVTETPAV